MTEYSKRIGYGPAPSTRSFQPAPAKPSVQVKTAVYAVTSSTECPDCKGNHALSGCKRFQQSRSEKRAETVRKTSACIRCLDVGHRGNECTRQQACGAGGCKKLHHPLLHDAPRIFPSNRSSNISNPNVPVSSHFAGATLIASAVLLPIVPVKLEANGRQIETFAFLDQGSEVTLLQSDIARQLKLDGPAITTEVHTVNGGAKQTLVKLPSITVSSQDNSTEFEIQGAFAIENLRIANKLKGIANLDKNWPHLKGIQFHASDQSKITILIGADQPAVIEILEYR